LVLTQGKYHPAISLFNGANVTVNFGPNFLFNPPKGAEGFCVVEELTQWGPILEEYKAIRDGTSSLILPPTEDGISSQIPSPAEELDAIKEEGISEQENQDPIVITGESSTNVINEENSILSIESDISKSIDISIVSENLGNSPYVIDENY
jgi:hypothetical protein